MKSTPGSHATAPGEQSYLPTARTGFRRPTLPMSPSFTEASAVKEKHDSTQGTGLPRWSPLAWPRTAPHGPQSVGYKPALSVDTRPS